MYKILVAGTVSVIALWVCEMSWCQPESGDPQMAEHKLIHVAGRSVKGAIRVSVGDMLQLQPFRYPLTPKFVDAKLRAELTGDRVLDVVGQTSTTSATEGRTAASLFLYVQAKGETVVMVELVREDKVIPGYRAIYTVRAGDK